MVRGGERLRSDKICAERIVALVIVVPVWDMIHYIDLADSGSD